MSLILLPHLFAPTTEPPTWAFIIFFGLDWVATVPPTVALCDDRFGFNGPIVFGWVFASQEVATSIAAEGTGMIYDHTDSYDLA